MEVMHPNYGFAKSKEELPEQENPLPRAVSRTNSFQLLDAETHKMWQLSFGACGYETRVWINGKLIRTVEGEEVHIGEYTSFSFELLQEILRPVNRITVRIADT